MNFSSRLCSQLYRGAPQGGFLRGVAGTGFRKPEISQRNSPVRPGIKHLSATIRLNWAEPVRCFSVVLQDEDSGFRLPGADGIGRSEAASVKVAKGLALISRKGGSNPELGPRSCWGAACSNRLWDN